MCIHVFVRVFSGFNLFPEPGTHGARFTARVATGAQRPVCGPLSQARRRLHRSRVTAGERLRYIIRLLQT